MISSLRSVMTLLLLAGLAACDRQSPPAGQANASASGEVTGDEVQPAAGGSAKGDFNYTIDRSKAGTPAPTFAFENPQGGTTTLQDFAGRPLLVNLWATWCAPCVAEMPTLDALAAQSDSEGDRSLAVLTISQDVQGQAAIKPFFAKHKLPHLKGWTDPENKLGLGYATGVLPTTVLYDAKGKEVARVVGAMDWTGAEARKLIAMAKGE